jgi:diaminobutyrate-2-oxoglutarate transaminase
LTKRDRRFRLITILRFILNKDLQTALNSMIFDAYVNSSDADPGEFSPPAGDLTPSSPARTLLDRQAACESNARTYARRLALALRTARGAMVVDADGREYIDCLAGAGTLALGHNHPVIVAALRDALDSGAPLHGLDLATPLKDEFVQEVFASLPPAMSAAGPWKIQFCSPSGADGVEAALKLAKIATGRSGVVAFHGAYHGMTHGALALTGNLAAKSGPGGLMPGVHFLPFPYAYRCPFGLGDDGRVASHYLESVLRDPESGISRPAAVIVEPVQGEGGVIPAPDAWLRHLRQLTRDLGIPLIVDEVQTGIGRTGRMLASEHSGIVPDILILSKAIGGSLPMAVIVYKAELDVWSSGAHTGTFRGNQLAMAAGAATLRLVRKPELLDNVERQGARLEGGLAAAELPCIGEIRRRGLMLGVEIVDAGAPANQLGSRPAAPKLARAIQLEALARGLIVELGGRHGAVVRLLPPLIIDDETTAAIIARLTAAMRAALVETGA